MGKQQQQQQQQPAFHANSRSVEGAMWTLGVTAVAVAAAAAAVTALTALVGGAAVALAACALALYLWRRARHRRLVEASLPGPPLPFDTSRGARGVLGSLLFGHVWAIIVGAPVPHTQRPDVMGMFAAWRDASAAGGHGCFRLWAFHPLFFAAKVLCVLHDPPLVKALLSRKQYGTWAKGSSYVLAAPLIGRRALLAAPDGALWHRQRRLANAGFRLSVLRHTNANVKHYARRLAARWDAAAARGDAVNVGDDMLKLTIDVLGKTAFSYDFNSVSAATAADAPLFTAFDVILKTLTDRGRGKQLTAWLPTAENRRFDRAVKRLDDVVAAIVKQRAADAKLRASAAATGGMAGAGTAADKKADDLLDQLVVAPDGDGNGDGEALPQQLIVDNVKTLLFAGHDTTASALAWALYLVSTHREAEARLLAEFASVDADVSSDGGGGDDEYKALERLPFLGAVIKEVLRLYPSAGFTRTCASASGARLGKYFVPAGADVYVFPYLLHRDPRFWPDAPNAFKPDRWLSPSINDAKGRTPEQRGVYLPFSLGMRNCVGRMLALAELRAALKFLLQRYRFTPGPEVPKVVLYMTLCPNRIMMGVERR